MTAISLKTRLLAGATFGVAAFLAASPAQAVCTVTPAGTPVVGTVTCTTTTTTNDTYGGVGTTASNRNYSVDTSTTAFTGTVSTGAVVDGFGLAFSNTVGGANALNVVNNGAVQVNVGNLAAPGGAAALNVNAVGATPVNYSGTGSVTNLGTGGNGLEFQMTGTGALNAVVGGNVTSAVGGNGILAVGSGASGNLSVTTATGTTVRADAVGVFTQVTNAANTGTVTVVNNATVGSLAAAPNTLDFGVSGESAGTGAVSVTNNGAVGLATDRTLQAGVQGQILNGASAATLTVGGTGAVFSSGPFGVRANNTGTGTTTVNYTGAVNTTGATGVSSTNTAGLNNVTTGAVTAGTDGVVVTSTGVAPLAQTINANGVTTGTLGSGVVSNSAGTRTIAVGTAGNVTGGTQAVLLLGAGAATVNNSGIIGGLTTAGAINGTAAVTTTVNNLAGGVLNGRMVLGTGTDSLVNGGTFNTQGTTDFGAGADVLNNQAAGTINILGATTFANLETFTQAGRINLNANTLTLSGTAFTNGGTIDTSGAATIAGITSFSNTGTLDLAPGAFTVPAVVFTNTGTILADEGASSITGQTSFANSGTLNLQDGATGDVLTINSNFVGSGGSNVRVDVGDTVADLLATTGATSGSSLVNANFVSSGLINLAGVRVVDNITSTAGAFSLGAVSGNTSPLVNYALVQSGADFFITSTPTAAVFDPVAISNLASSIWYQSADEVQNQTDLPSVTVGTSFWGQAYYSQDKYGDSNDNALIQGTLFDVDNRVKTKRYGVQAGIDYGFGGARVGLTGGYGQAKTDNDLNSRLRARGWNVGLYGQFGGYTGFHGSALIKYDDYKLRFTDGAFDGNSGKIRATGVDGSLGYRFGIGETATLDAKVGLSHVRTKIDNINDFGFNYDFNRITSTRGRAGLRATFGGNLAPYIDGSIHHEFSGRGNVELFDGLSFFDINTGGKATWGRIEAGIASRSGPGPILAAWGDFGDKKGFGLRAGFRFGGRAEEMLPPPPPPPAPEPERG